MRDVHFFLFFGQNPAKPVATRFVLFYSLTEEFIGRGIKMDVLSNEVCARLKRFAKAQQKCFAPI